MRWLRVMEDEGVDTRALNIFDILLHVTNSGVLCRVCYLERIGYSLPSRWILRHDRKFVPIETLKKSNDRFGHL